MSGVRHALVQGASRGLGLALVEALLSRGQHVRVFATARDFARFGQLYLDDGVVGGQRVVPEGWRDLARAQAAFDDVEQLGYGRHWWLWPQYAGSLACQGYEGQYTLVVPDRDLVVVHLGKSPEATRRPLRDEMERIVDAFAPGVV
jgi:CubicO group peptidase (beta-lactamase class C family)